MNGYQITFFTQQDHRHKGKPIGDWLVHLAQELDLRGATLIACGEGFGHPNTRLTDIGLLVHKSQCQRGLRVKTDKHLPFFRVRQKIFLHF